MPGQLTSAVSFIALLDESDPELQAYALKKLNEVVDTFWAEIADEENIGKIEKLYEDKSFSHRKLAALVASKVYYHLGEFPLARSFALGAEDLFDLNQDGQFVNTLINKFIDEYIRLRVAKSSDDSIEIDPRHEDVVQRMFQRCFAAKKYRQAIGIGLESRRLDQIRAAILESGDVPGMLAYCFDVSQKLVSAIEFRHTVFRLLVELYMQLDNPNFIHVARIHVFLDDVAAIATLLQRLVAGNEDDLLMAYQIAFDLCNNATQEFRGSVRSRLPTGKGEDAKMDTSETSAAKEGGESTPLVSAEAERTVDHSPYEAQYMKLHSILSGEVSINLHLDFLHRRNRSDMLILRNIKNALDARNSVTHSALIYANALMHAGTTSDSFLRENLEWLSKATNWAKFSATGGLGTIHKGNLKGGMNVLRPYLPPEGGVGPSPYSEGGALYALGIIHTNHGEEITPYLKGALQRAAGNEVIQHGGCLGLGVAGMGSGSNEIYEILRDVLHQNTAVPGEAAGLAMGLVMMGTADDTVMNEMLQYAHDTQHEKTIRGLSIGIALLMYGQEENAITIIEQLTKHEQDPILRYGGAFTIGMAFCGTANNDAIQRLLHMAVSDVNDDVRRAAVMNVGFLLSNEPEQCPRMVQLLSASYNPHVRYGASLAIGIACAGTGSKEAIDLLIPMAKDPVHFVSQGALMALAMVLIQKTEVQEPKVAEVRKLFMEKVSDKHETSMAKFGAILGQGIIDAGGRNVTIAPHSISGHTNMSAMAGLAVFTQHWYWYPLVHFISLSFTPTAIIGLTNDLQMPKFEFRSNIKPSQFAYPEPLKAETKAAPTKVKTAVLSTTKRAQLKDAKKQDAKKGDSMDVEASDAEKAEESEKKEEEEKKEEAKEKVPEPDFEILSNPARIVPQQLRFVSFDAQERFQPVIANQGEVYDIVMLRDTTPGEPLELVNYDAGTKMLQQRPSFM